MSLTLIILSTDKEIKMPATLTEWPTTSRGSKYDWDTLFDGKIYKLIKGDDFECDLESFRVQAYGAARNRGLTFRSTKLSETELAVQAVKGSTNGKAPVPKANKKGTDGAK
tara:strand:- start:73 stop:405 length:333 start_codon:yes stop_codon:yes gene_type:complete